MKHEETGHDQDEKEYPVLLRATDGGKVKFSTQVRSSILLEMWLI